MVIIRDQIWWTKIWHDGKKAERSLGTTNRKLAQGIEAKIRTEIIEGSYFKKPKGNKIVSVNLLHDFIF